MRQELRIGIEGSKPGRIDFRDHGGGKAVDPRVLQIDRRIDLLCCRVADADMQKVVRHELEEVEALQLALHPKRRALHLERRLDEPDLAVERAALELVVEALERLVAREERTPRVVERREVLAQVRPARCSGLRGGRP